MSTYGPETFTTRDGQPVTLRHAVPADAAAVLEYLPRVRAESENLASTPADKLPGEAEEVALITQWHENEGALFLLGLHEDRVVASCGFTNGKRVRERHTGELGIAVRKAWQGRGVGRAMMRAMLNWAQTNPLVERVSLRVFTDNTPAIALYRKLGFVEEGLLKRDMKLAPGRYADTLIMARWVGPRNHDKIK